jgi:hypothetical protein
MFSGVEVVTIPSNLSEDAFEDAMTDSLRSLGRVTVNSRGSLDIEARDGIKSFLTDVSMEGTVRRKKNNDYEVSLTYTCSPSVMNWVLAILLFLCTMIGAVIILVPLLEKDKVGKAVKRALTELEDATAQPRS